MAVPSLIREASVSDDVRNRFLPEVSSSISDPSRRSSSFVVSIGAVGADDVEKYFDVMAVVMFFRDLVNARTGYTSIWFGLSNELH